MNNKKIAKELREQNEFLQSMINSFEDIKRGRVKKFEFSNFPKNVK